MLPRSSDPIAAIATAPGRGAVGIVRVSGRTVQPVIDAVCGRALKPRQGSPNNQRASHQKKGMFLCDGLQEGIAGLLTHQGRCTQWVL